MLDASSMTPDQLRQLADKKEEESQVVKIGFLKQDLYICDECDSYGIHIRRPYGDSYKDFWMFTSDYVEALKIAFAKTFRVALKKGTKFVCFIQDGEECWYDDVKYGVEEVDARWAAQYLENITEVKHA